MGSFLKEMFMSQVISSFRRRRDVHLPLGLLTLSLAVSLLLPMASPVVCSGVISSGSEGTRVKRQPGPPGCAEVEGICEDADDYPEEVVQSTQVDSYEGFFTTDKLDKSMGSRADSESGDPMCESTVKVIFPRLGLNSKGQWVYIANQRGGKIRQGVRAEICKNKWGSCQYGDSFPQGTNARCKQKFIYRRLIAVSLDGKTIEPDEIRVPSCCSCSVKTSA